MGTLHLHPGTLPGGNGHVSGKGSLKMESQNQRRSTVLKVRDAQIHRGGIILFLRTDCQI